MPDLLFSSDTLTNSISLVFNTRLRQGAWFQRIKDVRSAVCGKANGLSP